ncbi:MAG: VTT domain-containing protein [Patescibacteria group bacterium]
MNLELFTNIELLVKTIGYLGIFTIIFAESGLLVGFFLPGDSLLFTAGLLAAKGYLNLVWLIGLCFLAAVLGDSFGYAFGHKVGKRLFKRKDSFLFNHENLQNTQRFYEKYGSRAVVLARFVPVVRTFAPVVAGIAEMNYRKFLIFNLIGGVLWAIGLNVAGFFLGQLVPDIDKYLLPIILLIIMVSFLPGIYHLWSENRSKVKVELQ